MGMLLEVPIPVEAGNAVARSGNLGTTIKRIVDELKPEAALLRRREWRTHRLHILRDEGFLAIAWHFQAMVSRIEREADGASCNECKGPGGWRCRD